MSAKNERYQPSVRRYIRSEQTRQRMADAHRGRRLSTQHRHAISVAMKKAARRG